ncbi:metallophosphoesterase [Clostridium ihumii]|uniref:metallophosphoesterase n=1 Tax=Clostridium ihumii TaxID=1470356 RepID=UPI0005557229|nr:metallophosphoesterase [Clostridium ihumii]
MIIGVMSDTHGEFIKMDKAMERLKECNIIFHLGDNYKDVEYLKGKYNVEIIAIKGNCDTVNKLSKEKIYIVNDKTIFLTHGDCYNVKSNILNLTYRAFEVNADIVLYGHTHIPIIDKLENIIFMNPGSVGKPRNAHSTAGIIEINDKNEVNCNIIEI